MSQEPSAKLSPCGCCATEPEAGVENRPGLDELSYRIGAHSSLLARMIARLHHHPPLDRLTTRRPDDLTLTLLDAWAVVGDVLTFYQERVANEGYLRTAKERRSVLELARSIAYELNPGVAASAFLAFTVESAVGSPGFATVPAGAKVQSVPGQGQRVQTFETSAEVIARAEWNELRPRLTQIQPIDPEASAIYLQGAAPLLKPGQFVLLVHDEQTTMKAAAKKVRAVIFEPEHQRTRVELANPEKLPVYLAFEMPSRTAVPNLKTVAFNAQNVAQQIEQQVWSESTLSAHLKIQSWSGADLVSHMRNLQTEYRPAASPPPSFSDDQLPAAQEGVYAFRARVSPFGHNAPRWDSLPLNQRKQESETDPPIPYAKDWDTEVPNISQDSQSTTSGVTFFCERLVEEIVRDSWVLLHAGNDIRPYRVLSVDDESRADFALSAKCTGANVAGVDGKALAKPENELADFKFRTTSIYAGSEALPLAALPISNAIGRGQAEEKQLTLDRMVLGLEPGRAVILTGELDDLAGVEQSELLFLDSVFHQGGFTTLFFKEAMRNCYVRNTVKLNANVVRATHGETVQEILGSGDATRSNQRFALKKPPLTFVSAATPTGSQTTLFVRVNDILWEEMESLYGAEAGREGYIVRIEDDGKTAVTFGDGGQGARLPTGLENVQAAYRSGIGPEGEVAAGSLTLLPARPLGIRQVTNPLPAGGAQVPETREAARQNAPRTVLTLGRIVSLRDFEDFARGFRGIGKAQATVVFRESTRVLHITVGSATGQPIDLQSDLMKNLRKAVDELRAPGEPVELSSFQLRFFSLSAKLLIDPRRQFEKVRAATEQRLAEEFSFDRRDFAQPVTAAEVVRVIQSVPGVVAVDLDKLYLVTVEKSQAGGTLGSYLEARPAELDGPGATIRGAELLLLHPAGVSLEEKQV